MATNKRPGKKYVPLHIVDGIAIIPVNRRLDGTYCDRDEYVKTYRRNLTRVVQDIASGKVEEQDLEALHNFHQMALALMQRLPMADLDKAWRNAEAMAFLNRDLSIPTPLPENKPE